MTKNFESNSGSDTDRKQQVRQWISARMRKWSGRGAAGGLGSVLMALPALGQATVEELYAFQFAETIPGVKSVKLLKNGDVLLKMADGRTMVVAAENVQILDSGAIMIAEDAVAEIAQFGLAAEAGGAAGAGIGSAGAVLGGIGLAGAAAAGGGGGGGGDDDSPVVTPPPPPDPNPVPSYPSLNLAQAQSTVLGSNGTGVTAPDGTDTVEITIGSVVKTVTPNDDGSWSISLSVEEAADLPQGVTTLTIRNLDASGAELSVETVQFDIDTIPPVISITGVSDGAVLNATEQMTDLTVTGTTNAEDGQTVTVSLNGQTYTGIVSGGHWSVSVPAADLAALPDGATVTFEADVSDQAGNPAEQATSSFDTDFTAPTITLDPVSDGSIGLADLSSDLTLSGTTTAADGQNVVVIFNGQVYSGTASGGSWNATVPSADLAGLATGTPVSVSVTVSDTSGNFATPATATLPVDLSGPSISISPLSVGAVLNNAEAGSDLTITGTTGNVQDGQQVTVTLNGQTYNGTVSTGAWAVTVPAADLTGLADGSGFSVTADVSDDDGLAAPQASTPLTTDFTPPALSIDNFSAGAIMNASEQGTDLTVTGATTAEDGQMVTVSMNGQSYTGVVSDGGWSVTVPAADLAALSDGVTVSVSADVSDTAGNPAVQATGSFDTDFSAPSIAITSLSDGAIMNAAEQGTDLTVSGTSDAPDGTLITIEIARSDGTVDVSGTAVVNTGGWTYTATGVDLSALQDGEAYGVSASVSDADGNSNSATDSFATDFTAPSITLDPPSVGAVLDVTERDSDLVVSGNSTAENGQTVTVSLGGQSYTGVVSAGAWTVTIPSGDLSALADGTSFPITATVDDLADNNSVAATTTLTTDFRPLLTLNAVGSNNSVSLSDAQSSGLVVSGNSHGLNTGQAVNVTLNGISVGSANVGSDGSWSLTIPSSDFSGLEAGDGLNFSAQATVSGGPDPLPVSDSITAHEPAAYVITEAGRSGSTVTFEIYADPDRDVSGGLSMTADLEYDPSVVTYDAGSAVENGAFDLFLPNPVGGDTIRFGGAATTFPDLSQPLVTFTMTVQDPSQPIELTLTTDDGGPVVFHLGTTGSDTLTATNVDNILRGGGGDDTIDVSDAGRDVIVFEADPLANGVDMITGFTLGLASDASDALMFSGLDVATLRGNGTGVESLAAGDAIGTDTGFVGLTTVLTDLNAGTLETAVESFTGVQSGDEIYVLATDGTDGVLIKVDYSAPGAATVETVADFAGLDDLSGLSADNILHTDPTGASA
ncbi:MAG: Ig-like domain-containing protein [Ruegeria sp.]